ncbi:MAG: hypothetical protein R6W76_02110 [Caldilinea sp.]
MIDRQALLTLLDQKIARAGQEYALHTGNQTACQLHKDGRVAGGLKYDEGRLVALTAVRRIVRKLETAGEDALLGSLQEDRDRWRRSLVTYQTADRPSITWIAYSQGGVDAIEEMLAIVADGGSSTS